MLYKMNTTVMSTVVGKLSLSVSNLEETHKTTAVNLITNFECHSDMMQDKNLRHFYDEVLEQLRKFVKCKEELIELRDILGACIGETAETENGVKKLINTMFEQATEKEFSTLSKYDAYLYNRKEYDKNYDMWADKNVDIWRTIASAFTTATELSFLKECRNLSEGKSTVTEVNVENLKKIIHSAIQKKCETKEVDVNLGILEKEDGKLYDIADIGKDGSKYGKELSDFLSGKNKDSLSKKTGIEIDKLNKMWKYSEGCIEVFEYLMTDYSKNMEYLDSLKTAFSEISNPKAVDQVISELERKYTDKFSEILDGAIDKTLEVAENKTMKVIFKLTPITSALSLVSDGTNLILDKTGCTDNMNNWTEIYTYNNEFQPYMDTAIDTYLDKYNSGTATMEDINTLNTLIEVDGSMKEIMYERMSIKNEGLADEFSEASDLLKY